MYYHLHLTSVKFLIWHMTRNHETYLEVWIAETPVTMRVCGCVQIEESGLFYPVVLPNFQRLIFGKEKQVARIAPNRLRFFPFWASAMYFQLHLIAVKLRMCNLIRNPVGRLCRRKSSNLFTSAKKEPRFWYRAYQDCGSFVLCPTPNFRKRICCPWWLWWNAS